MAFTRTASAFPSSVGDAGHGFCASCLRVLRKVFTLVWSGLGLRAVSQPSHARWNLSTVHMDSHDALHCRQEGDVQVTEKWNSVTEQRTQVSWSSRALGQRGGHSSMEIDFSVPGIYIRTG